MPFDLGSAPTIYCVNEATAALGVTKNVPQNGKLVEQPASFNDLVTALGRFAAIFAKYWGSPCTVVAANAVPPGHWGIVFLDDADQADAEGYHDDTADGVPLSKVFVKTTIEAGDKVSVTASHELAEMLVDPATNLIASNEDGSMLYAYEVCDAVEETEFPVNGIAMSNFVLPSWFEGFRAGKTDQFDYLKLCKKPFELLAGGYISVFKRGRWTNLFGSEPKAARFAKEDRRGHRNEERATRLFRFPV